MPFQRLDAARGGSGHSGLGLAIANRVAQAHGGGLERLESTGGDFGIALCGGSVGVSRIWSQVGGSSVADRSFARRTVQE